VKIPHQFFLSKLFTPFISEQMNEQGRLKTTSSPMLSGGEAIKITTDRNNVSRDKHFLFVSQH